MNVGRRLLQKGRPGALCLSDLGAQNPVLSFDDLIDRAMQRGGGSNRLVETAHYLGLGISNLLKGLSPEAVIVGGRITRAWPIIADELTDAVGQSSICRDLNLRG